MEQDAFIDIGHTGFLMDAKIMAAILYDWLTDANLRAKVTDEHGTLAKLLEQYHAKLRETYAAEIGGM
jgi:hypothetical protein